MNIANLKPLELTIMAQTFAFIFDEGMIQAVKENRKDEYLQQKIAECLFSPIVAKIFKPMGKVSMKVVMDSIRFAQAEAITKGWLAYHNINFKAQKFKGLEREVKLSAEEVVFYLRSSLRGQGNKFIAPKAEHILSTILKAERSFTSLRRFRTIEIDEVATKAKELVAIL
jgi:hypothetical protein